MPRYASGGHTDRKASVSDAASWVTEYTALSPDIPYYLSGYTVFFSKRLRSENR